MKLNLKQVQGVFIDLDNTLYDYTPCNTHGNQAVFSVLASKLGLALSTIENAFHLGRKKTKDFLKKHNLGIAATHSRLLYFQKAIEELTGKTDMALTLESERVFWDTFISRMELLPHASGFLEKLKKSGRKIVIITDMTAQVQMRKLLKLDIHHFIDYFISSEEAGHEKPHPAPLELALIKTNLLPQNVVMIGEDEEKDIKAAINLQITPIAIRFKPNNQSILFAEDFKKLHEIFDL